MPYLGIFVESRLRHLLSSGETASMVVAPVPWFPFQKPMFGRYGAFARVPVEELRHGVPVLHPRYPLIPKLGMSSAPFLMYAGLRNALAKILKGRFRFDLIDAHYFYPDGVAAVLLGRSLGKPVVITGRGTDVNLIPEFRVPRRLMRWAAAQAAGVTTVSEALRARLIELGVPGRRIEVLRNGVDLELFAPQDRAAARRELGLDAGGPIVLSVGWLIPRKGHDLAIRAAAAMPEVRLVIVGDGPEGAALQRLAKQLGSSERVHFLGSMPQEGLATRVQCRRRAGARFQPGGISECSSRGARLRHAGRGHRRLGHARDCNDALCWTAGREAVSRGAGQRHTRSPGRPARTRGRARPCRAL